MKKKFTHFVLSTYADAPTPQAFMEAWQGKYPTDQLEDVTDRTPGGHTFAVAVTHSGNLMDADMKKNSVHEALGLDNVQVFFVGQPLELAPASNVPSTEIKLPSLVFGTSA